MSEHCTSNFALRVAASSPSVISAVNTLTLLFVLHVPVQPENDGALGNELVLKHLVCAWYSLGGKK